MKSSNGKKLTFLAIAGSAPLLVMACSTDPSGPLLCPVLEPFETSATISIGGEFLDVGETASSGFNPVAPPGAAEVFAFMSPGLVYIEGTCNLRQRDLPDDTLHVLGLKLRPDVSVPTTLRYETQILTSAALFDTLQFTVAGLPTVDGLEKPVNAVSWHGISRRDQDTVVLDPDEDLVLHLNIPAALASDSAADLERWTLDLVRGTATITLSAPGTPPDSLLFPAALFPGAAEEIMIARLTYQRIKGTFDPARTPPYYLATTSLAVRLRWVVRFQS